MTSRVPYVILSARDRYARENGKTIAGPSELFVSEAVGGGSFLAADDLKYCPPAGSQVILCGQAALSAWAPGKQLNTARGHVFYARGCECVATWMPIDCVDAFSREPEGFDGGEDDDSDDDKSNGKDSSPTSRKNYRFWFLADVEKLLKHTRRAVTPPQTLLVPSNESILDTLSGRIFFDIETHPPTGTVQCWSICDEVSPVYTFPVWDHRGAARTRLGPLFSKLISIFSRCTTVGHNISFDLGFLAHAHRIPWGPRIEDTMVQHHRAFPESEKSLAHVISYWTNNPYHKDTAGTFTPYNEHQYRQLLTYNAADVATTRLVWMEQRKHIASRPGLAESVRAANESIEVYLRAGLTGFEFDEAERARERRLLNTRIANVTRIFHALVGYPLLPSSPQQLGDYLYQRMKYPVADTTDKGAPSTDAKALYKLAAAHDKNVALRVLLELRDLEKQESMLKFKEYYRIEKR